MKAIVIEAHGGPEQLRLQDRPSPRPGPGEVLVDIAAAASTTWMSAPAWVSSAGSWPCP